MFYNRCNAIILLFTGLKLSYKRGPIIFESIDLHIEVPVVPFKELSQMRQGEPSAAIRERAIAARKIQERHSQQTRTQIVTHQPTTPNPQERKENT